MYNFLYLMLGARDAALRPVLSIGFLTACASLALGLGLNTFFTALDVTFILSALTF